MKQKIAKKTTSRNGRTTLAASFDRRSGTIMNFQIRLVNTSRLVKLFPFTAALQLIIARTFFRAPDAIASKATGCPDVYF